MLSYLDTSIGLAVVMLGVSLLITILTQMVSALVIIVVETCYGESRRCLRTLTRHDTRTSRRSPIASQDWC